MQRKIFVNFFVVVLIGVLISGILSVEVIENRYNDTIEQRLISNTYLMGEIIGNRLFEGKPLSSDEYLSKIKNSIHARITIIDAEGKVLADTEKDPRLMDNHAHRPEIEEAMKGELGKSKRYSDTLKVDFLYIAQPIYKEGKLAGILRLSTPLFEIINIRMSLYISAFISVVTGLLIASLLGYRMSVNITKPLKEMTFIASQISGGQFEKRIEIDGKEEIGELANSINYMASTLNDTIDSLSDENVKMEAILSSVVNGIIAIDSSERILFINPVAIRMLNIKEVSIIGKHFLEVVRNNQLDDFLRNIISKEHYTDTQITTTYPDEKVYKVYTNPIKPVDKNEIIGIIIVMQDITELRKLENMRTEFVANVSHELKTPLTSIKGFVETLKSGAIEEPEDSIRFLNIIEDEADRLYRLIADILSLSELENKKSKAVAETIHIKNSIQGVVSMLSRQARLKNIELTMEVREPIYSLTGDPDKFKQMLINLVDNAIKYTPENGKVKIEGYNKGSNIRINVIDNGIGIPKEHIPRLFERFYRVDKARSRKVGGTGLGLAIVKHIVKLFEGEIEVESKAGKGTKFKITIPGVGEKV